jgi:hypothetical protein
VRPGAQAKAGQYVTIMFKNKWQKQENIQVVCNTMLYPILAVNNN